jgi:hypothetical protein
MAGVLRTLNPMAVTKVSRLTEFCAFFRMFQRWALRFLVFPGECSKNVLRHEAWSWNFPLLSDDIPAAAPLSNRVRVL